MEGVLRMGRVKLDDAAKQRILGMAPDHSLGQIVEVLAADGIDVNRSTVSRLLKRIRHERGEETRHIVQSNLAKGLLNDLEVLERVRNALDNWWQGCEIDGKPMQRLPRVSERLMVIDRLATIIDKRLKYSGADPADGDKTMQIAFVDPDGETE